MDLGLAGRVALVCGSTKGLGRAVAKALAQEGARVAVNGRHDDAVEQVAQQLASETRQTVLPFVADVGVEAQAEALVERVHHRSEEHTSELQSPCNLVCRLLLEKKKNNRTPSTTLSRITTST